MDKLDYIESLGDDELRYEVDKVYARLKEIDMLRQVREDLPEGFLNPSWSLLEGDFERLQVELGLFQRVIFSRDVEY